jgi:hypothetical protein
MRTLLNPLRIGDVERYYTRAGTPVCDVSVSDGGYFVAVPVRCFGQGTLFPVKQGDRVHLYFPDGRADLPYVVGIDYKGKLPATSDNPGTTSDYSPSLEDAVITHASSHLSLSQYGITLEPNGSVRIQLSSGQVFRVSVDGDADDKALRGQEFIDALFPLLLDFERRLNTIDAWISGFLLNVGGLPPQAPVTAGLVPKPYVPIGAVFAQTTKGQCEDAKSDNVVIQ